MDQQPDISTPSLSSQSASVQPSIQNATNTPNPTTKRTPKKPTKRPASRSSRLAASQSGLPADLTTGLSLSQTGKHSARASVFLTTLFQFGAHGRALGAAGVQWSALHHWRHICPDFDTMYKRVLDALNVRRVQQAREALHSRAVDGVDRPVFQGGRMVGVVREYSDKLLETELKALDPATFGPPEDLNGSGVRITINLSGVQTVPGCVSVATNRDQPATKKAETHAQLAQPVDSQVLTDKGDTGTQPATKPDAPASDPADSQSGKADAG